LALVSVRKNGGESHKFSWKRSVVTPPKRNGFGTSLLSAALGVGQINYAPEVFYFEAEVRTGAPARH
jgi:hypothetical protein